MSKRRAVLAAVASLLLLALVDGDGARQASQASTVAFSVSD